jgi:glutamate:Na+ symporter, ESS family
MTISPFALLALAIPVLLLGEQLTARVRWLGRLNIPAPIVGGLIVAVTIVLAQERGANLAVLDRTSNVPLQWIALPQWHFAPPSSPPTVYQPLLIAFFTCIGLNASWAVARAGGLALLGYLGLAALLAVIQYATGVGTAAALGQSPLLGAMCSGVSLMGGFGTAAGFAGEFERAGLRGAGAIGIAAAAFGVIAGGLIAGPMAGLLMRRNASTVPAFAGADDPHIAAEALIDEGGFFADLRNMWKHAGSVAIHLVCLAVCLKLGAFLAVFVRTEGSPLIRMIPGIAPDYQLIFPIYMGSMFVGVILRNIHDLLGLKILHSDRVDLIASFCLAWLLAAVMISLKLLDLTTLATPMFIILVVQVVVMIVFCYAVVFRVMGRNYEAAAMSAGMVGFGLGATSNAVATMRALAVRFGPAPRAFLIVTVVGAFLIDFVNATLITICLSLFGATKPA